MTQPSPIDLSIVVFACDHVPTLNGCVHAAQRARRLAEEAGFSIQSLMVLHENRGRTAEWCRTMLDSSWEVSVGPQADKGARRNAAFDVARGTYVAFAEGTDLWSGNWLLAALRGVIAEGGIWHPEMLLTYSGDHFTTEGAGVRLLTEKDGELESLLSGDALPTGFLCERELVRHLPFPHEDRLRGHGQIDRWWHCNAALAGLRHRVMPATFHYRRRFWSELIAGEGPDWRGRSRPGPLSWPEEAALPAGHASRASTS